MNKKSTALILFFSILIHSIRGMEENTSRLGSLDKLPSEIIVSILCTMINPSIGYESVNDVLGFISINHWSSEFMEEEVCQCVKATYKKEEIDYNLALAIKKSNLRIARILIKSGGQPNPERYVQQNSNRLYKEQYLTVLNRYAQLLKLSQLMKFDSAILFKSRFLLSSTRALIAMMMPRTLGVQLDKKDFITPIKTFLNALRDNEDVIEKVLEGHPYDKNVLAQAAINREPKVVTIILRSIDAYPNTIKKLLETQNADGENVIIHALKVGHWKIIEKILKAGKKVGSIHLEQKHYSGRSLKSFAKEAVAVRLLNKYSQ